MNILKEITKTCFQVPRDCEQLLETAVRVMHFHASRKSVLEIEYVGEEGTGLGPTLEFYALVAAEFQVSFCFV
jgi:E3 ubiquitin-protein ligase HECTD1